jgi:predicted patatin/cPLA2 family phospholipase
MLKKIFNLFSFLFPFSSACNVLTLSGGGVYGSFEAGVFSTLFENGSTYDIITGVSAGSLNTAYLSSIQSGQEKYHISDFKNLWTSIKTNDILHKIYFLNGLSLYDNTPIKNKLNEIFSNLTTIRDIKLGATSLIDGTSRVFTKNDVLQFGLVDILMSSIAIPIFLPPYPFLNDIFVDGGLTSNILLNEGIDYCLKKFPLEKIYVDVIVCGKKLGKYESMSMTIKDIAERLISIITEQVEYSELLHPIFENNVYIRVFEQQHQDSYGLLDFDSTEKLYNEGYNFTNVNIYWLNNTKS